MPAAWFPVVPVPAPHVPVAAVPIVPNLHVMHPAAPIAPIVPNFHLMHPAVNVAPLPPPPVRPDSSSGEASNDIDGNDPVANAVAAHGKHLAARSAKYAANAPARDAAWAAKHPGKVAAKAARAAAKVAKAAAKANGGAKPRRAKLKVNNSDLLMPFHDITDDPYKIKV